MKFLVSVVLLVMVCRDQCIAKSIDEIIKDASPDAAPIHYNADGSIQVEYDILYTPEQWQAIQQEQDLDADSRSKRKAIRHESYRWPNNEIPYAYAGHHSSWERQVIERSMREWEKYVCVTFRPRTANDRNYLYIQSGSGCSSYVGSANMGPQAVTLGPGCVVESVVIHELGHAIGFQHEQCRPDRDSHITVYLNNVEANMRYNFNKMSLNSVDDRGVPYDYGSIMHYGQYAFSNNGQKTIITKDPAWQNRIGNARTVSFADLKLANSIYKCSRSCSSQQCSGSGYMDRNCACQCPGSPITPCGGSNSNDGSDCVDNNSSCSDWASVGECDNNPNYMLANCKMSCNVCGDNCKDANSQCDYWASIGECVRNPGYMLQGCQKSCHVC